MTSKNPNNPWMVAKREAIAAAAARRQAGEAGVVDQTRIDGDNVIPLNADPFFQAIRPLGYSHDFFYYFSVSKGMVMALTPHAHAKNSLLAMAPMQFWSRYQSGNGRILWDHAVNALMTMARTAGVYDPSRHRGRGAWIDNKRVVYHLGNKLLVGEDEVAPNDMRSWWIYEAAVAIEPPNPRALRAKEAGVILRLAQGFRWSSDIAPHLLTGWCIIAAICGALEWRPHIWVTGGSGTGKTTLARTFIKPLLGPSSLHAVSNSTEPGIRQALGNDALPVLFDEAESTDPRSLDRIQATLEMMRQSSSESGGKVYKGDPSGSARDYEIRSCFGLVSNNPGVKQTADASRISFLTMLPAPAASDEQKRQSQSSWEALERKLEVLTPEFCSRLFARTVLMIPTIRANARVFSRQIALKLGNARLGDQIGTLLAGAQSAVSDRTLDDAEAAAVIAGFVWDDFIQPTEERDDFACLRHLLQHKLRVETETGLTRERPVAETLAIAAGRIFEEAGGIDGAGAQKALKRNGMAIWRGDQFAIASNHTSLAAIFRGTGWVRYREQLSRLPFVLGRNQVVKMFGSTRATLLKLDDVLEAS